MGNDPLDCTNKKFAVEKYSGAKIIDFSGSLSRCCEPFARLELARLPSLLHEKLEDPVQMTWRITI